ncbi:MAG: hypothetical protein HZB31_15015 [Nitrospirae bacterium]|nr:hypothetical protein [Nitrospirota bacterium]
MRFCLIVFISGIVRLLPSAFGLVPLGLIFWVLGVAIAVGPAAKLAAPDGIKFSAEPQSFFAPGSWLPLVPLLGKEGILNLSALH